MDTIGIVACSAPGAALCYQTICSEAADFLGGHEHPDVCLHAHNFGEHVRMLEAGDWAGLGRLLLESAVKLASIGAKFAICPDNTVHQALDPVRERSPIPWLHIAESVAHEASRRGARRLGVLGTRYLMEGPVYAEKLSNAGIDWCIPEAPERERIHSIIFDELVYGRVSDEARGDLARIIGSLQRERAIDAVVLGCTELPLAVDDELSPVPTLDSTRLLARAAIARSVGLAHE